MIEREDEGIGGSGIDTKWYQLQRASMAREEKKDR